jgi:hypothetical protein
MSKFFAIIVEDVGDESGKLFANAEKFMVGSKIDVPNDCEILSCVEIRSEEVSHLLGRDRPYIVRVGEE